MKNLFKNPKLFLLGLFIFPMISCEDNGGDLNPSDPDAKKGTLAFSITDAPVDNADVSAAFVTITEIKVDGKVYEGFKGPKTIDILSLQNGNSLQLGEAMVGADSYSKIALVIDAETDQNGASPGCYIVKAGGVKDKLELAGNAKNEIELNAKNFVVESEGKTEIIMDFDLRKAIKHKNNDYAFVTAGELKSAIRAGNKQATGTITGNISNFSALSGQAVVYAYKKGSFNKEVEAKGQGASEIKFSNAVTSAKVDGGGNFKLSFLEAGEYEIQVAKPESETNANLNLNLVLDIESAIDLKSVAVKSNTQTSVSLKLKTILGL